jgi:hypothetical protein
MIDKDFCSYAFVTAEYLNRNFKSLVHSTLQKWSFRKFIDKESMIWRKERGKCRSWLHGQEECEDNAYHSKREIKHGQINRATSYDDTEQNTILNDQQYESISA